MERRQHVAAVILAAGESRRFGAPKQLARLGERTLLEHVLELARRAGLEPVVAVVPVWLSRPAAMDDPTLRWVRNPHPEQGMSHSLRLGFAALPRDVEAAVILLGDQPTVGEDAISALILARGDRPMIATQVAGRLAAPVLIERSHFGVVEQPRGDIGLRDVLAAHPEWVLAIEVDEVPPDVDSPDDLARIGHMFDSGARAQGR
jgi:molybdenum cofactor cytidylyltransferase